jgi:hypothetical protein
MLTYNTYIAVKLRKIDGSRHKMNAIKVEPDSDSETYSFCPYIEDQLCAKGPEVIPFYIFFHHHVACLYS